MEVERLRERCRQEVRRILAQRNWNLIQDEAVFVEEVCAEYQRRLKLMEGAGGVRRPLDKVIEDAIVNRYNHHWHAACGANGTLRQRQAFLELYAYLLPVALYCSRGDQNIAEESAQQALITIWQKLDRVRDAGSFSRWASTIACNEARGRLRQALRIAETPEIDLQEPDDGEPAALEAFETQSLSNWGVFPGAHTDPQGFWETVERLVRACLATKPDQLAVFIGRFLYDKSVQQLADELGIDASYVYVLIHRAKKSLRNCKQLLDWVAALG